ncbi:MAG: CpsB/CapC family capsule biosynthesis tyrosine phosphatase, partial [Clostridium sp.]|uniref:CpsB/CapC family capsule biosynthesis tyrosine phosphatase n=1 Tax=Clostridium sp. TaxID=1506 RepID=UPI0029156E6C
LILAPAYYDEESKTSIIEVEGIVEELNAYLKEKSSYLALYPANLIRDNYDSVKDFLNKRIGTINKGEYALLNSEESSTIDELLELVFELNLAEVTPIIVGPEKNEEIKNDYKKIDKLINKGCLFQLDVESLNGTYGKSIQKACKKLIKKNAYDFIGFEENIKKELIDKEVEKISKKGLYIFKTDGLVRTKSIEKKKKIGSWIK